MSEAEFVAKYKASPGEALARGYKQFGGLAIENVFTPEQRAKIEKKYRRREKVRLPGAE